MRRLLPFLLAVAAAGFTGCFLFSPGGKLPWRTGSRLAEATAGPDVVDISIEVATPSIADRYVNDELWTAADEQILPRPHQLRLAENGLRVGLFSGHAPDGLLEILSSKRTNPNPDLCRRKVGVAAEAVLATKMAVCDFPLYADGEPRRLHFEDAAARIQVIPSIEPDGKVRLQFTPQLEYRDPDKWSHLNPALALSVQGRRSTESFASLRWEISLGANEFVVIGTRLDKPETLGYHMLVTPDPQRPIQRLVAVKASRTMSGTTGPAANGGTFERAVASQAGGK
jgi:hypothetical protein